MTNDHQTEPDDLVERLENSKGWPNLGKAAAKRIKDLRHLTNRPTPGTQHIGE